MHGELNARCRACPRSALHSAPSQRPRSIRRGCSNPGSLYWSVHELLELCESIPSIASVWWQASAPSIADLRTLAKRLPPTVTYLAIDITDIEFRDFRMSDWAVFAELTQLTRLCVSVDSTVKPYRGDEDEAEFEPSLWQFPLPLHILEAVGPGPRNITFHLSKLMPHTTVLVHTRTAEFDIEIEPRMPRPAHQDHCQPSLLLDAFLPGVELGWASDPCRRGPADAGTRRLHEEKLAARHTRYDY